MKKILILIPILIIAAVVFVTVSSGAVDKGDDSKLTVTIAEGSGTGSIAAELKDNGLIKSELVFKLRSKLGGYDGQYKPGGYLLSKSMDMKEIMNTIRDGNAEVARFTIPEGYNIEQTMQVLIDDGLVTEDEFMEEVRNGDFDYDFLDGLEASDTRLEGYLYPETYDVYMGESAHDIINRMLAQFDKLFIDEYKSKAEDMDMSINDIVAMASIIEKESVAADERPIMAGVFYNRMEEGMPLQSCATIQYILGEAKQFLSIADTQIESPYNTYLNDGLPPGPICSPRIESIEAALYPDDNDYIYFVLKPDLNGEHNFSSDYDEFLKDKEAYNAVAK